MGRRLPRAPAALALAAALLLSGCAAGALRQARTDFYGDRLEAAADVLEREEVSGRDRLLYLMEKGLVLHHLGRYEGSTRALLAASRLMEEQDVVSVSQQAGSLIANEWVTEYKGEYSERLWVHTYLMMNFLLQYQYEKALVEAKQALKVMEKTPEPLGKDHFTRGLIAMCYENLGLYSDAYIEYRKLAEQLPDPSPVAPDLHRLARRLGFVDAAARYEAKIPASLAPFSGGAPSAELVLFVGVGRGPVKIPGNIVLPPSIRISFPRYTVRGDARAEIRAFAGGGPLPGTAVATDLVSVAEAALEERAARMFAKESARAALKEATARAVERNNDAVVAAVVRLALFLLEEPDTRGWETLPGALNLVRFRMKPGRHDIRIRISRAGGTREIRLTGIEATAGRRIYHSIRVDR